MKEYPVNYMEKRIVDRYKEYAFCRAYKAEGAQKARFELEFVKAMQVANDTKNLRMVSYVKANQYGYWKAIIKWVEAHHKEVANELNKWEETEDQKLKRIMDIKHRYAA